MAGIANPNTRKCMLAETTSGGSLSLRRRQCFPSKRHEIFWIARLHAEDYVQSPILRVRVRQAADHDHWNVLVELTEPAYKLDATNSRHEVIGNNDADLLFAYRATQQSQTALGAAGGMAVNGTSAQHHLAQAKLLGVIVH